VQTRQPSCRFLALQKNSLIKSTSSSRDPCNREDIALSGLAMIDVGRVDDVMFRTKPDGAMTVGCRIGKSDGCDCICSHFFWSASSDPASGGVSTPVTKLDGRELRLLTVGHRSSRMASTFFILEPVVSLLVEGDMIAVGSLQKQDSKTLGAI